MNGSTDVMPWDAAAVAHHDQFQAGAKTTAVYAADIRDALLDAGFTREEAVLLVAEWLQIAMTH